MTKDDNIISSVAYNYKAHRLGIQFEALSSHLHRLNAEAARHVVAYFESVAYLLRQRRRELDARARQTREIARRLATLPAYPDTPSGRRMRREAEGKARAIKIMRLAQRGYSNQEIGRVVTLTPGQVSRIIRQQLKLTRSAP